MTVVDFALLYLASVLIIILFCVRCSSKWVKFTPEIKPDPNHCNVDHYYRVKGKEVQIRAVARPSDEVIALRMEIEKLQSENVIKQSIIESFTKCR